LRLICRFRGLLGLSLHAGLFAGDSQITHLPPHEQSPCAYQYQHLDELERHGALAIGPLALL
jgi:hypothetical protein